MTMLSNVRKGRLIRPVLLLVYGPGGIGKSTWASRAPRPIFLGAEEGTDLLDVARLPTPHSYEDVLQCLKELEELPHDYQTLVVDSLDWIEPHIFTAICKRYHKPSIEQAAGGYGKGYIEAAEEWQNVIFPRLNALRDKRGMNIILLAHPEVNTITNPINQASYQKFELKLHKRSKAKMVEFVDAVFFASYEMYTSKVGDEVKSFTTKNRVLQGVPNQYDGYDAKNRYGLTEPVPLSLAWDDFVTLCNVRPEAKIEEVRAKVTSLLPLVTDSDVKVKAEELVAKAWEDVSQLTKLMDRLTVLTGAKS
jgi:hypothetical protein